MVLDYAKDERRPPAEHTPGPWTIEGRRGPGFIISAGINAAADGPANYVGVIDPLFHVAGERTEEHAANARLIAAAPVLLEKLTFAVAILEEARARVDYAEGSLGQIEIDEAIEEGYAAIAKATGQ